jgi:sigma-E factor negative regulatory protein RseC
MIEEEAVVARVEAGQVWVEKTRKPACGSCARPCATAAVGDYLGQSTVRMAVLSTIDVRTGDRVVVGVREDALVKGSLSVYLLPLLGLFAGSVLGKAVGGTLFSVATDIAAAGGGLFGLIGTMVFLKFTLGLSRNKLQPVVLRKLS